MSEYAFLLLFSFIKKTTNDSKIVANPNDITKSSNSVKQRHSFKSHISFKALNMLILSINAAILLQFNY